MLHLLKNRWSTFFLITFIVSSTGCNQETEPAVQTDAQNLSTDQLLGSWTGYTVDQNASSIDQKMQQGTEQDAMKMQFQQQKVTFFRGQMQPIHGEWKVLSKNGEHLKIAVNLPENGTEPWEFDIKFSSKDRLSIRQLKDGDESPQTFTRIR